MGAYPIGMVWGRFEAFIEKMIRKTKKGILVAWNVQSCDMEWIYRITQIPNTVLNMPSRIKYFMDRMDIIKQYKGCKTNQMK